MADRMLYPGERRPSRLSVLERRYSHLSSDTTSVTIDESMTEEEVLETLQAHKQIISTIKTQTWPMHRKLKVLRKAKMYIKKHEGELKQSKQAKDIMAKYKAYMEKTIKKTKREIANLIVQMTPWEMRIKKIESQFGSVVASYFTFLRWVFWINTFISGFICIFLMVPEVLRGHDDPTGMRKEVKNQESALTLQSIWDFEGYLKFSPIFYGYYSSEETTDMGYRLPLAYFLTSMILYLFSFFCILRKMTQTARMSRAGSQDDEYVFSWKVFTGWDYLIGNSETAYNKVASIVMGLKEVILEEKERKKEEKKDWKMIVLRVLANVFVLFLLGTSAYAVVLVVERSQDMPESPGWVRENEVTLVVAGIGIVYPNIFNLIGMIEAYHPGIQLRWQLARILVLNLLNLYTLMFSLFGKVDTMTASLQEMKTNITYDKRIRMSWETEVMITVMTEKALERYERSLERRVTEEPLRDDEIDLEEMEGRYWWRGADGRLTSTGRRTTKRPNEPQTGQTATKSEGLITTTVASSTAVVHHPVVIKDEWTSSNGESNGYVDIIEGRKALPAATTVRTTTTTTPPSTTSRATTKVKDKTTSPPKSTSRGSTAPSSRPTSQLTTQSTLATVTGTVTDENTIQTEIITTAFVDVDVDSGSGSGTGVYEPDEASELSTLATTTVMDEKRFCGSSTEIPDLKITDEDLLLLSEEEKETLRTLCWETMFGQELTKLTVMDFVLTAVSTVIGDFLRAVVVRYCNGKGCFFWDLEKGFPGYSDFPIAENILHLVNNQGMVWLGMFFSPGLPAINTIKLCLMMYLRSWAVLTCNIPHETVFKASGNNFYYALLLLMLFICCLPVAYTCVWLEPSWHCGPFSEYERVYHILTKYIESKLPDTLNKVVDYLTSPGSIIPLLLLLVLIIYYLLSTVAQLKEANADLKGQLRKEKDSLNPEMAKGAEGQTNGLNALAEKKHVRIQEETVASKPELQLPDDGGSTTDNS